MQEVMQEAKKRKRVRKPNPNKDDGFSLARPSYKNEGQRKRKSSIYHCRFKDTMGVWRRLPLFTDRQSSAAFACKIVLIVSNKSAGKPPSDDLSKWADQIDAKKRDKLVAWGILDQRHVEAAKSLGEHLGEWKASILAKGSTEDNAQQRWVRVKKVLLDKCGYNRFADIENLKVEACIAGLPIKMRTRNHYASALRQFCNWMVDNDRASHSPLKQLRNVTVTDEQLRRSLTTQSLIKLLGVAMDGPDYQGITGWERCSLYWLASETGYRANELRSLKASSIKLDTDPATVTVKAESAKGKKRSRLSITPELAARMRVLLRGKSPSAPAFKMPAKTAKMLRFDLERAGIPYINDQGEIFDFHALRVQLASSMARAGVHVKVMQERMRHKDSKLTLDLYSRLSQSEQDAAAVEALPRMSLGA